MESILARLAVKPSSWASAIVCALLLANWAAAAFAQQVLHRRPSDADFRALLTHADKVCNVCEALLSRAPLAGTANVGMVFASEKDAKSQASIQAVFVASPQVWNPSESLPRGFFDSTLPHDELHDAINSRVYTVKHLAKLAESKSLSPSATLVVRKGMPIDTSLLVEHAGRQSFVVEQVSTPDRFAENLSRLREREPSQKLTVFDFAPRSVEAIAALNIEGKVSTWRNFSGAIRKSFAAAGATPDAVRGGSTLSALVERLKDPSGGVVILYAHSDGERIFAHTASGIESFGRTEIMGWGAEAGGMLPPIVLLNCQAKSAVGSAFLDAGSPFVVATDRPLRLDETAKFLNNYAHFVYRDRLDVVDGYYEAQRASKPTRLHPIAGLRFLDESTSTFASFRGTAATTATEFAGSGGSGMLR